MAQIFYVHCPSCRGKFPCHMELWQVDYALLCPFCQTSFHQEESPLIISAAGEQRPGSRSGARAPESPATSSPHEPERPGEGRAPAPPPIDPSATADSM